MPFLRVETNVEVADERRRELLGGLSSQVASMLGKSEDYMMVMIEDGQALIFGASDRPSAFVALKSIGLDDSRTGSLSDVICATLESQLGIPPERIYIEFSGAMGSMWGWNRQTF